MPAKRKAGKSKKSVKEKCTRSDATPPQSPQLQCDESPRIQASQTSSPTNSAPHSPIQPQEKSRNFTDLTVAEEEDMASWLEENELIYNKKLNAYKDFRKKDALWESKATAMGKSVEMLKVWYRSIRTRFTRLLHRKSGDGATEMTERDNWVLANFAWLRVHVVEVQKKTTVSLKEKLGLAASIDDGTDYQSEDPTDTESVISTRTRLEPLPRRSATSSSKKVIQEEERLLSNIAARDEQSIAFQTKVLEMLAPSKATERTRYADWAKEVMVSLHPSLWLQFQRECSNLLYTYQEKSEELLNPLTQQHQGLGQQPQYVPPQQQQYQFNPRAVSRTSPTIMWQPPPQQWPTTAQETMPGIGPQASPWVQGQMHGLQPMTPTLRGPSAATRTAASAVTQSAEPALSLSQIISSTIGMSDTDTTQESAVATMDD